MTKRALQFEENKFIVKIPVPEWYWQARMEPGYVCSGAYCRRFIDLPCRTCKYVVCSSYIREPIDTKPFIHAILSLRRHVGKDLAAYIVKRYTVFKANVRLTCGYLLLENGNVVHEHCVDEDEIDHLTYVDAEIKNVLL